METAEPGTPEEYEDEFSEDAGEPTLADELATLPPQVLDMLSGMAAEMQELRAAVAERVGEPDASEFMEPIIEPLPEGTRRYVNTQYSEETMIRQPGRHIIDDGVRIWQPQKDVTFSYGLYTTSDPQEIEFLETHEAFGVRIYRDDSAQPDPRMPGLTSGVRDSGGSPRNPLAAPMG